MTEDVFRDAMKDHARQVVAKYHATGLAGMSRADMRLLHSEKSLHLSAVSERLSKGEGLHVNLPIKRGLEAQLKEIGEAIDGLDREQERGR